MTAERAIAAHRHVIFENAVVSYMTVGHYQTVVTDARRCIRIRAAMKLTETVNYIVIANLNPPFRHIFPMLCFRANADVTHEMIVVANFCATGNIAIRPDDIICS